MSPLFPSAFSSSSSSSASSSASSSSPKQSPGPSSRLGLAVAAVAAAGAGLYLFSSFSPSSAPTKTSKPTAQPPSTATTNSAGLTPLQVDQRLFANQLVTLLGPTPSSALSVTTTGGGGSAGVLGWVFGNSSKALIQDAKRVVSEGLVLRYDTNEVASNDPIEDRHCEMVTKHGFLFGIFDGHGGYECADVVSAILPMYVAKELNALPAPPPTSTASTNNDDEETPAARARVEAVRSALEAAFVNLDNDITGLALDLPTWAPAASAGGSGVQPAGLAQRLRAAVAGSCALVAYVEGRNVYVACSGDSRAVLGRRCSDGAFEAIELSADQTGKNPDEYRRLLEEHPGEQETVIARGRVLGRLMPTRAFGDSKYKWPESAQTSLVPQATGRPLHLPKGYLTPPYVTAKPVVTRHRLDPSRDRFLVLATDGLYDELDSNSVADVVAGFMLANGHVDPPRDAWVRVPGSAAKVADVRAAVAAASSAPGSSDADVLPWSWTLHRDASAATCLVRNALSGKRVADAPMPPEERIARLLAIPSPYSRRFRDDMTVTVVFFGNDGGGDGLHVDRIIDGGARSIPSGVLRVADGSGVKDVRSQRRLEAFAAALAKGGGGGGGVSKL
ncbi:phosphatase 2C-like domain-containing protein [Zopfochytrium polystomum]|nr:phosphatase 2C-like domain-containing protein [Zopfochytrium polystomum]